MYLFIGLLISACACAGMIINYIMINIMIRNPDMPSRGEDRQILIRTLVLITADMLCWVPTLFFGKKILDRRFGIFDFSTPWGDQRVEKSKISKNNF